VPFKPKSDLVDVSSFSKLKYKDIFDLGEFYDALHEYLQEMEWKDEDDQSDHWETYYGERVAQGGAKEIWWRWRMLKKAQGTKLTYFLDMTTHLLGVTSAEIVRDGQKIKTNKAEIEMSFRTSIQQDYLNEFRHHLILKHFGDWFAKKIYFRVLEQRKKELYQEAFELQSFMKQWFKMKRYLPYEETKNFFPSYAWPSHQK